AKKVRARSRSFFDHFSQARLFFNSQSEPEKDHLIDALNFELGKVVNIDVRKRMLRVLGQIDKGLATSVALALRLPTPKEADEPLNQSIPADANPDEYQPVQVEGALVKSTPLSMANTVKDSIVSRKIAFHVVYGVDLESINAVKKTLDDQKAKAIVDLIAPRQGFVTAANSEIVTVRHSCLPMASVLYDAVYVPGGANSVA